LLAACQTPSMGGVFGKKSQAGGVSRVYPVDQKQAWDIAARAFRWEGAGKIEEHREDGFQLTTIVKGASTSYAGAWIEPAQGGSKVTCVVDGDALLEQRFHDRFAQALSLLKQGGPLPDVAPPLPEGLSRCASDTDCDVGTCVEGRCRR
ncbi:MAG TPA: hypothetical protein VE964_17225, partial [Myxococcales bacterium]|nr:hypothetical protein [Myxococcales bacterium]